MIAAMPLVSVPGATLYFEEAGEGPPVLLVNGSGTDLRMQPGPLEWPVGRSFSVAAYDHRGLGRSVPDDPDHQPTMADFAADAVALCDHLGWDRFGVLGISFGGMVAQHIALAAGDRVTRLVLGCTSSGGTGGASYPLHEVWRMSEEERLDTMATIMDTRAATDPAFRDVLRSFMSGGREFAPSPDGLRRQMEARRLHDTWDRLPSLRVPTLVAAGRYDGIAPLANSEALAARIPGAELQVFEGGHGFFMEDPAAWPAMTSFLLPD